MRRTGIAELPLHDGKAPAWLFQRMTHLSREILKVLVLEFGAKEILRRLSDPFWFQALGCVLGFDWHSSGLTTTVCGAIKEGIKEISDETGLFVAGGKGRAAIRTPTEIHLISEKTGLSAPSLIYASRLSAKVDNSAIQDGYSLYHHTMFFTIDGNWCVVQQGMNAENPYARRYHWLSENVKSFVCEPHAAICAMRKEKVVLNLIAKESEATRRTSASLAREHPDRIFREWRNIERLYLPRHHFIGASDINPKRLYRTFIKAYEAQPKDFEGLLGVKGVGPKSLRALSLISELIYGERPSFKDPARFGFAHGGKDRRPYPVNLPLYDKSIEILKEAVNSARLGYTEKLKAIRRLSQYPF
ncbi:MAG: hypothetical protein AMJ45_00980 [Syntrophobacter sp. DG_60]|nr:MAG: hypothetical protein AMJ45_00980 [Syntrophobacter sp. DG_60]